MYGYIVNKKNVSSLPHVFHIYIASHLHELIQILLMGHTPLTLIYPHPSSYLVCTRRLLVSISTTLWFKTENTLDRSSVYHRTHTQFRVSSRPTRMFFDCGCKKTQH